MDGGARYVAHARFDPVIGAPVSCCIRLTPGSGRAHFRSLDPNFRETASRDPPRADDSCGGAG